MTTQNLLTQMRANASIHVSTEGNKSVVSKEETDVIINIDQARTDDGAAVDTSGTVEDTLANAADAQAVVDSQTPAIAQGANDIAGLESARVMLGRHKTEKGGIDMQSAPIIATTLNNCLRGIGLKTENLNMPSTEAFGGSQSAFDATRDLETNVRGALTARRIVNLESVQLQAEDRETANGSFTEAAEAILERAAGLERVAANINGEPGSAEIDVGDIAKSIGSKNGSVAVAASNLAAYVKNVLVTGATQYNTLGNALAEVTPEPAPAAVPAPVDEGEVATGGEVNISGTDGADNVSVTVDGAAAGDTETTAPAAGADTPAEVDDTNAATDKPAADTEKGTDKVSTEDNTVDKDLIVTDTNKESTIAKPEDADISTSDTAAEAGEGTQIATDLPHHPSTESDDVSVSDIVENFNTDEDLPGDAVIQSEDEVNLNDDGDDVDLSEVAKTLNSTEIDVSADNYEGGSTLPALDQASAMLVVKSVREIAEAVIAYQPIASARGAILDGTHAQLDEVDGGELPVETADQIGSATDFGVALYRTVSDTETKVVEHALNSARALLTYVSLSCKAYTETPSVEDAATADVAAATDAIPPAAEEPAAV